MKDTKAMQKLRDSIARSLKEADKSLKAFDKAMEIIRRINDR